MLKRLSDNLLKLEHHSGMKTWADELRKLATTNIDSQLVFTKKSELNLYDKDVAWSIGFLEIRTWSQPSTISRAKMRQYENFRS